MTRALILGSMLLVSCLRDTSYHCSTDSECGAGGTCVPGVSYCSIADMNCPSGSRFGSSAGSYANKCVGDEAPIDAPPVDSSVDTAVDAPITGCPSPFAAITGGNANHTYRVIMMTDSWQSQRAACLAATSSAYLAIPDDLTELQAIATLSGVPQSWVGITDSATENTFLNAKGVAQVFLPWDGGQPDDSGPGEDCVIIQSNNSKLRDERCSTHFRAVCECE